MAKIAISDQTDSNYKYRFIISQNLISLDPQGQGSHKIRPIPLLCCPGIASAAGRAIAGCLKLQVQICNLSIFCSGQLWLFGTQVCFQNKKNVVIGISTKYSISTTYIVWFHFDQPKCDIAHTRCLKGDSRSFRPGPFLGSFAHKNAVVAGETSKYVYNIQFKGFSR